MQSQNDARRIHILRDSEARKIAAGEVIDRPFSVVRELLDNALDASADEISLYLEEGGINRIRVVDNGFGMDREDLELCFKPHATSKIERTEDIYQIKTLGFRGEALSSIAECAKLAISSTARGSPEVGSRVEVHAGKEVAFGEAAAQIGTVVDVRDLFYSLPGRRKFLKRLSAETRLCRQTFLEKALAFPKVAFRLFVDDDLKLFLPPASPIQRVAAAYPGRLDLALLDQIEGDYQQFSVLGIMADPVYSRRDRRFIQIFVNGRRVQEYSFIQAVTYGYSELMPGGSFPAAFLFLEIEPNLVDFNIHPAKREVRIRNAGEIHRRVVSLIRAKLTDVGAVDDQQKTVWQTPLSFSQRPSDRTTISGSIGVQKTDLWDGSSYGALLPDTDASRGEVVADYGGKQIRYLGHLFSLFILVEYGDVLYIIDQHAAHERIIFERLRLEPPKVQTLLVPVRFELDPEEEKLLIESMEVYGRFGIELEQVAVGTWELIACPEVCMNMKDDLLSFIARGMGDTTTLEQELYSIVACRSAITDGEVIDRLTAVQLAAEALGLEQPRCPHGRPIWHKISKDTLYELVERTI